MNIIAMEIRTKNTPGGLARGGWLLHVIYNNTSQFLGYVDYEDARNFRQMDEHFSVPIIYLGWIDVEVKEWMSNQHHRPGSGDNGHGHNGPLNRWDKIALAITGN